MEPRLHTSSKWVPFPTELVAQIEEVTAETFADFDLGGKFIVDGIICPNELVLRIGLHKEGKLRQNHFEASLEFSGEEDKTTDLIHLMVDFLGQVWESFLEDEPEFDEMPLGWVSHRFEKKDIFLRYTSANTLLEQQADELLKMYEKKLVYEIPQAETEMSEETTVEDNLESEEETDRSDLH